MPPTPHRRLEIEVARWFDRRKGIDVALSVRRGSCSFIRKSEAIKYIPVQQDGIPFSGSLRVNTVKATTEFERNYEFNEGAVRRWAGQLQQQS